MPAPARPGPRSLAASLPLSLGANWVCIVIVTLRNTCVFWIRTRTRLEIPSIDDDAEGHRRDDCGSVPPLHLPSSTIKSTLSLSLSVCLWANAKMQYRIFLLRHLLGGNSGLLRQTTSRSTMLKGGIGFEGGSFVNGCPFLDRRDSS